MIKHWLRMIFIMIIVFIGATSTASAHANLERSVPLQSAQLDQSPSEIRIQFTEQFDEKLSQIVVVDANGKSIEGKLSVENDRWLIYAIPPLTEGVYTVKWQVLSVDTHVTEGSYRFSVGVTLEGEKPSETISLDDLPATVPTKPVQEVDQEAKTQAVVPKPTIDTEAELPKPETNTPPDQTSTSERVETEPILPDHTEQENVDTEISKSNPPEASSDDTENESIVPDSAQSDFVSENADHNHAEHIHSEDHSAHGDHGHEHKSRQWQSLVYQLLRIIEVFAAICLLGFLVFRYVIASDHRLGSSELSWLSIHHERKLYIYIAILFAFTGGLHVSLLANQLSGFGGITVWDRLTTIISSTTIGKAFWINIVLMACLFTLTYGKHRKWTTIIKLVMGVILILLFPLTGHAFGTASGAGITIISHLIHMLAAAIWFGGLVGLWIMTYKRSHDEDGSSLHILVQRFSVIAFPSIFVVIVSGIVLALYRLPTWESLFSSKYGQLILIKSILLLSIIGIAVIHRYVFMPRMNQDTTLNGLKKFVAALRLEIIIAVTIIVLAGMLSSTTPPDPFKQIEPIYWHEMGESAHMSFRVNNGVAGGQQYQLDIWLPTDTGAPAQVDVQAVQDGQDHIGIPFTFRSGGPDPYGFEGFDKYTYESMDTDIRLTPGVWTINIHILENNNQTIEYLKEIEITTK